MRAGYARCWHERISRDERLCPICLACVRTRLRRRDPELRARVDRARAREGTGAPAAGDALVMARHKRLLMVLGIVAGVSVAASLGGQAFKSNGMFFFDPSQIAAGVAPADERFRLGGMVEKGSVAKTPGTLDVKFLVTD